MNIFRTIYSVGFRFFVFLFLLFSLLGTVFILNDNQVKAASSVTLNSSGYSDPDAEDSHIASQWVVRDSGAGIYDSGEDAVNLTSITLSGALFTDGTTYFWKVRHKDEHDAWSVYSAESSFVYNGGGSTPTPTPTTTASSTATSTATPTATPTTTPTATVSPDPENAYINIIEADVDCQSGIAHVVTDLYNPAISPYQNQVLVAKIPNLIVDIYLDFDTNPNFYSRISNDYDYLNDYQWVESQYYTRYDLRIGADIQIPQGLIEPCLASNNSNILVHAYSNVSQSWGSSLSLVTGWTPFAYITDMADKMAVVLGSYVNPTPTPTPTSTSTSIPTEPCLMEIRSPARGDSWEVNSEENVIWDTDQEYQDKIKKININLSRDDGRTVSDPLLVQGDNSGFFTLKIIDRYITNRAVMQFIGTDQDGKIISYCQSDRFRIVGPFNFGGFLSKLGKNIAPAVLLLGALISTLPMILMLVAMIPAISQLPSRIGMLFMPPAWPKEKPAWGIVYDAVSKKPIPRAVMRIFSEPGGKQRDVQISNEQGEFGFLVPSGDYSITASVEGFSFPTYILLSDSDGRYANLYRGGKIKVTSSGRDNTEKAPINLNIPMDPSSRLVFDIAVVGFLSAVHKFAATIRYPVMVVGTLASIYLVVLQSRFIDWFVLAIYVILWILELRDLFKKRTNGIVVDNRGNPVALAIVRLINEHGRIVSTVVTGDDGKFIMSVDPGTYRFDVAKPGYNSARSKPYRILRAQDLHNVKLGLEKIAKTEGGIKYRTDISS